MNDWQASFLPAIHAWLNGGAPYIEPPLEFASPPWTLPILAPLVWVPPWLAMFLPALALLYCAWRVRKPWLIPLVGLSFPFIAGSVYANIDWLVMVGVVIGGRAGVILNTVKPQAGIFANVALMARCRTWRERLELALPLVLFMLATLPLWGDWFNGMRTIAAQTGTGRNFSPFPYLTGAGVVLLVIAWKRKSILAGVLASLALAPYWYIHSCIPALFLIAHYNWRHGLAINLLIWLLVALIIAGIVPISL